MGDEIPQRDASLDWLDAFWNERNAVKADANFTGSRAMQLARKALVSGGQLLDRGEVEWDCSGNCMQSRTLFQAEVAIDLLSHLKREAAARRAARAVAEALGADVGPDDIKVRVKPRPIGMKVSVHVRCRECRNCLEMRARMWSWRAVSEWEASERTWFGTLTLRPAAHDRYRLLAQRAGDVRANDFDLLTMDEQLLARHRQIGSELTLFLKRVRKNSGAQKLRYLLVMEAHKSGLPHYHLLVHQAPGDASISYDSLRNAWNAGFSKWNLVHGKRAAIYCCKYLAKSSLARVRASLNYGTGGSYNVAASAQSSNLNVKIDLPNLVPRPAPGGSRPEVGSELQGGLT